MFRIITAFAKNSSISLVNPLEKLLLTILPVIIMGFYKGRIIVLLNIAFFLILHIIFKNPFRVVAKFILAVALFTAISSITMVYDYGIGYCINLILKGISSGVAVSFLVLTTPFDDILCFFSKVGFLRDICDISKSMERFLVLLEDEYTILKAAFTSRCGFNGYISSVKDYGRLFALLFMNTIRRWKEIKTAVDSRCFNGKTVYLKKYNCASKGRLMLISLYNVLLLTGVLYVSHK